MNMRKLAQILSIRGGAPYQYVHCPFVDNIHCTPKSSIILLIYTPEEVWTILLPFTMKYMISSAKLFLSNTRPDQNAFVYV